MEFTVYSTITKENKTKSNLNTYLLSTNGIQRKQSLKTSSISREKKFFCIRQRDTTYPKYKSRCSTINTIQLKLI
jgi:hypothetical protein